MSPPSHDPRQAGRQQDNQHPRRWRGHRHGPSPPAWSEPPAYAPPQGWLALQGNPVRSTPAGERAWRPGPEWPSTQPGSPGPSSLGPPPTPSGGSGRVGAGGGPLNSSVLFSGSACSARGCTGASPAGAASDSPLNGVQWLRTVQGSHRVLRMGTWLVQGGGPRGLASSGSPAPGLLPAPTRT